MGDDLRCPQCGQTGATRVRSEYEYAASKCGAARRTLLNQTDRYVCDECRAAWDEEAYQRPADADRGAAV